MYINCPGCQYFVPSWEGSKTSNPQPAFCLKAKISLGFDAMDKKCNYKED